MKKLVKFKWPNGRRTFLWPNHPLVLAGDNFLETVVDSLENNEQTESIVLKLSQQTDFPLDEIRAFVNQIADAINGMTTENVVNDGRPDADSLAMATINLTKNCNLRCRHCYAGKQLGTLSASEMTSSEIETTIQQLSELVVREPRLLIFSGGEPLLQKEKLIKAIAFGKKCGFNVRLNTNGLLLDQELAKFLADHQVLTQVSLDGADAETNAILRGSCSVFEKTRSAIELLVKAGCRTRISTTIHLHNVDQISAMIDMAEQMGVEQIVTSSLVEIGNAKTNDIPTIDFAREFTAVYEAVKNDKKKQQMTRSTLLAETITAMRAGIRFVYCGTGCSTICVDADGVFYPCINMVRDEFAIGKAPAGKMAELWYNSSIVQELRKLDVTNLNQICANCVFQHFCGGYCRGETLAGGGDLSSPYIRCREWKRGLIKILDILSESPDLYDFGTDPLLGVKHRE